MQAQAERLIDYPKIVKEWHPTRNGHLKLEPLTSESFRLIWWQCSKNPLHEWKESVRYRIQYPECPFCDPTNARAKIVSSFLAHESPSRKTPAKRKQEIQNVNPVRQTTTVTVKPSETPAKSVKPKISPLVSSSIATAARELVPEFHQSRNNPHTPETVKWDADMAVWWQCSVDPSHEWKEAPYTRTQSRPFRACPLCLANNPTLATSPTVLKETPRKPTKTLRRPGVTPPELKQPIKPTLIKLAFAGEAWIKNGPGVAACILSVNNETFQLTSFLPETSKVGCYWKALLLGLEKANELNLKGHIVAITSNSAIKDRICQVLSKSIPSDETRYQRAYRAKALIENTGEFEIQVGTRSEINIVESLIQQKFEEYLLSLLAPSERVIPTPLQISDNLPANTAKLIKQPYVRDVELAQIKLLNPRDAISEMDVQELSEKVPSVITTLLEEVFEEIKANSPKAIPPENQRSQLMKVVGLRWFLRGLPVELAIRKTLQFLTVR